MHTTVDRLVDLPCVFVALFNLFLLRFVLFFSLILLLLFFPFELYFGGWNSEKLELSVENWVEHLSQKIWASPITTMRRLDS